MARFTDSFRNYRPAPSCGNCDHGYDRLGYDSRNCSLHCGAEVVREYVCDDWCPEHPAECGGSSLPDDQEIRISLDGNKWCALCGPNLQEGLSGFGDTPEEALMDLIGQTDDQEIRISLDGDQWCSLRGPDLQEGESGFGPTPEAALRDLQIIEIRQAEYDQIFSLVQASCNGGWRRCVQCPFLTDDRCDRNEIRKLVSSEGLR